LEVYLQTWICTMKVLITGGWGWIGARIITYLLEQGHELIPLDIKSGEDILNLDTVRRQVNSAEVVIHLAGVGRPVPEIPLQDFLMLNVVGTANILTAMAEGFGAQRIIYPSSVAYYGCDDGIFKPTRYPVTISTPPVTVGINDYDLTKQMCHRLLQRFSKWLNIVEIRLGPVWDDIFAATGGDVIYEGWQENCLWCNTPPLAVASVFEQALTIPTFDGPGLKSFLLIKETVDSRVPLAALKRMGLKSRDDKVFDMGATRTVFNLKGLL